MPKTTPRIRREPQTPADLAAAGRPHLALRVGDHGALWLADCMEFLAMTETGVARLVIADPPYAIAKDEWDEFPSLAEYVDWCDAWLAEVHRVLTEDGTAYVCGFSEILAEVK